MGHFFFIPWFLWRPENEAQGRSVHQSSSVSPFLHSCKASGQKVSWWGRVGVSREGRQPTGKGHWTLGDKWPKCRKCYWVLKGYQRREDHHINFQNKSMEHFYTVESYCHYKRCNKSMWPGLIGNGDRERLKIKERQIFIKQIQTEGKQGWKF